MTRHGALLVIGLVLLPSAAAAQEPPSSILPGMRVRVWTSPAAEPLIGKVLALEGNLMTLEGDKSGTPVGVSRESITRIDVSFGRRSRGKSVMEGALTGLVFGVLLGVASSSNEPGPASGAGLVILPGLLAPVGACVGLVVGPGEDRWATMTPASAKLDRTVALPVASLKVSFRF